VIEQKLIELNDTENGYKLFVDDTNQFSCETVLKQCSDEIFKELGVQLKKKKYSKKISKCNIQVMRDAGYDKIRFKINSLLGLKLTAEQKTDLRNAFEEEIYAIVENTVERCDPPTNDQTNKPKKDSSSSESAEN
jgi:hypothetical protein